MLKKTIEIERAVADRIIAKIHDDNHPIETEIGLIREGTVKVLFIYDDYTLLNQIITDSINEECDLCAL